MGTTRGVMQKIVHIAQKIASAMILCYHLGVYSDYRLDEQRLRAASAAKGYSSLGALLRRAGLHRNSLNEYLEGGRSVFSSVTRKICDALDCDPLTLLSRKEFPVATDAVSGAVINILEELCKDRPRVALFMLGSRARGTHQEGSDIDIAITGGAQKITTEEYLQIKMELQDAVENLPLEVDLINFDQAPRWFVAAITYTPKFMAGNPATFTHAMGVLDGVRKT